MKKQTVFITVKDLQTRWGVTAPETIRRMAARYEKILKPKKIAGKLLFHPADVKKFEEQTRRIRT